MIYLPTPTEEEAWIDERVRQGIAPPDWDEFDDPANDDDARKEWRDWIAWEREHPRV